MGRIMNAQKEYRRRKWNQNEAEFYVRDIEEVLDNCNMDAARAVEIALNAGFMIGYRKGRKDAKQAGGARK